MKFRDLSVLYRETTCATCLEPLTARKELPDPIQCSECEGAIPMAKKKKKDFSEAVAASAEADAAPKGPRVPVIIKKYREKLPVRIDDAAVAVKAQELAKLIHEERALLDEKREANATYREKLNFFKERNEQLATSIDMHTEAREVAVVDRLIVETSTVEIVRQDTGEVVNRRAATAAELQKEMYEGASEGWTEGPNPAPVNGLPAQGERDEFEVAQQ